ncbi:MAG TPA: PadR family transcriptional regulator [Solirubrobacteraceae bacterium]|nr:PadR family transcriptional regulator [Solirubrobacteraceae bacterium]
MLIERRGYGYELVQRLSDRLGAAWRLNPSTVYGALDQLEDAELIAAAAAAAAGARLGPEADRQSRRAGRVVYEATDSGISEFRAWLARPSARVRPIRSEIQLKVALAGPDNVPPLLASIAQEEWTIVQRLHDECQAAGQVRGEQLEAARATAGQARANELKLSPAWPSAATALVNAAAATHLQAELAWIGVVRETLQRMSAEQINAAGNVGLPGAATLQ